MTDGLAVILDIERREVWLNNSPQTVKCQLTRFAFTGAQRGFRSLGTRIMPVMMAGIPEGDEGCRIAPPKRRRAVLDRTLWEHLADNHQCHSDPPSQRQAVVAFEVANALF